ncbi:MAG: M4 family metallopeptidase [Bacteroidota bacterium]
MNHLNSRLLLVMLLPALWLVTKPIFGQQRTLLQNDAAQAVVRNAQEIITDIQSDPRFIRFKPGTSFESIKSFNQTLALPTQSDLTFKSSSKDNLGFDHIKYTQTYKGIKILGSEYIFHLKGQSAISANGNIIKDIDVDIRPSIDEGEALSVALKSVGADEYMWEYEQNEVFLKSETGDENASFQPHGELFISSKNYDKTEPFKLVYRFDIYASKPLGRYNVEIDAQTGKVVNSYNTIHTSNIDVAATGESLYNGTVDIVANHNGTDYKLTHSSETSRINTYDLANGTNYSAATLFSETDSHFDEPNSRAGVSAHYGATATYAYFYNNFGRNSFDDAAGEINSYVHYSTNYVNAFWDGSRMTYGDGDGVSTTPLVSLDIVGHEIAHAVTQYSAGLIYSYESGALNESFSDIFGQSIEFETAPATASWYLADEIFTDGVSRIRAMQDPNANGHPDTYLGDFWFTGSGDNGGVHFNSGVQNFWYYLLVEGGSGVNDNGVSYNVPSIGLDAAQQIAYRNLTVYLTPSSQYVDARVGSEQAAADLFGIGSLEYNATVAAWNAVGVPSAEPVLSLADAIDFGNVPVGFPKTVDVNVANTGNGILEIQGIQIDNGAYSVSDPVFNLTELSSRNITFTLTPTVLGDLSATATVYSNTYTG